MTAMDSTSVEPWRITRIFYRIHLLTMTISIAIFFIAPTIWRYGRDFSLNNRDEAQMVVSNLHVWAGLLSLASLGIITTLGFASLWVYKRPTFALTWILAFIGLCHLLV